MVGGFFYKVKSSLGELPRAFLGMSQCSELERGCDLWPKTEAGLS